MLTIREKLFRTRRILFLITTLFSCIPESGLLLPEVYGQTSAKNRQDEKRENDRVEKARKELSQTQSELKKLQGEVQQKSKAFLAARGTFLQAKKKSDEALEQAEERVGESLGIPAQMQVIKGASLILQDQTREVLSKLTLSSSYTEIANRLKASEESLKNGIDPDTRVPIVSSRFEEIEKSIVADKRGLKAMEDAAIEADPQSREAKQDLEDAQAKLKAMKSKLSPSRIENDFAYKKAKTATEQAFKKMQSASTSLKQAELALQKKANEVGSDYQSYMKARQADAADPNRTKSQPKKQPPKKTASKKS